jgi:excisionase family DNA binding protein
VDQQQQLLTCDEVASRLGVHVATVRRLIRRGELPRVVIGRAVRVAAGDVEDLITRSREDRTALAVAAGA